MKKRFSTSKAAIAKRTDALMAWHRGKPSEWSIFHGIICMSFGQSEDDVLFVADKIFDCARLAKRCDEINRIAAKASS